MVSLPDRHRSETWICIYVVCFLFGGHLQLAESYSWTQLPPNPVEVFMGSTASLTWSGQKDPIETLTYVELSAGGSDIGDVNAELVVTLYGVYKDYMELKLGNQSITLVINGVKKSDAVEYCCKVVTSLKREQRCTRLKVFENFKWTQLPPNPTQGITRSAVSLSWSYDYGKDANLTAVEFRRESGGVGSYDIGNINQDGTVNVFGEYKGHVDLIAVNNSAVLTINRLKIEDDAEYCCKLKTTKGNVEKCSQLKILDPPTVSVPSGPVALTEGATTTLVCKTSGIPAPSIEWTKSYEPGTVLSNTSTLFVRAPENADRTIKYQCSASNGVGNPAKATVSVVVHYRPRNTTLLSSAVKNTVATDESVTFNCSTDANPPAHVFSLYHEGSLISDKALYTIERVRSSDEGKYTCVPSNIIGEGQSASVALTVSDPPSGVSVATEPLTDWWIILLIIFAGFLLLVLLAVIIYCCCWKKRREQKSKRSTSEGFNTPSGNMNGFQDQGITDEENATNARLLPLKTSFNKREIHYL